MTAYVLEVRRAVDARLEEIVTDALQRAHSAGAAPHAIATELASLVRRGGKRLRPVLLAASARACGRGLDEAVIEAGCAWELLQAYFLVHDDWMDGDATRRGGPTAHVTLGARHGEHLGASLAILAGDLGCALAHRALARVGNPEAMATFARVHEEVVLGQALDLTLGAEDLAAVERMHALKTASYSTVGPVELGAVLASASREQRAALSRYAGPLGVAFQLVDDLLGAFGSEEVTGKPVGSDLRARKRTALVVEAMRRASPEQRATLERWLAGEELDVMPLIVEARAAVEGRAAALLLAANQALDSVELADRAVLRELASLLVERRS